MNTKVGEMVSSADIRNATGANSERLCYIMGGLMRTKNVERVGHGIYSVKHYIPKYVTSCIVESANRGYGVWNHRTKKYLQVSPKWAVGQGNPWYAWYNLPDQIEAAKRVIINSTYGAYGDSPSITTTKEGIIIAGETVEAPAKGFSVTKDDMDHVKINLSSGNSHYLHNNDWHRLKKYAVNEYYGSMDQARVRYEKNQRTTEFVAEPGQEVFYIDDNRVCSATLIEVNFTWNYEIGQKKTYTTIHGTYSEDRVFASKEELIKSL